MSAPDALPPPALHVRDLTVTRGGRTLFSDLSFVLEPGQAIQLKGPNGAGKTSLLLALARAIRPESGTVEYRERGETADARPQMHVLLPQNALKPRLSVAENLEFWRAVNGATGIEPEAALVDVGLGDLGAIEAGHLSTGQLRRLALARLLVSRRRMWLLDEPTTALDTDGVAMVVRLIRAHTGSGGMALVATHQELDLPYGGTGPRGIVVRDGTAAVE